VSNLVKVMATRVGKELNWQDDSISDSDTGGQLIPPRLS
jgi:hypothetical protein